MDCGLVCLEFRGVFARVPARVGFPAAGRLARGPASRGPHVWAARIGRVRIGFPFFSELANVFLI